MIYPVANCDCADFTQGSYANAWRITNEYAKWAPDLPAIVVGGASTDNKFWDEGKYLPALGFPRSGVDVVAPAENVKMALAVALGNYKVGDGATSGGKLDSLSPNLFNAFVWCFLTNLNFSIANAMAAGLAVYFLGTKSHWDKIDALSKQTPAPAGSNAWPLAVKNYMKRLSHQLRDASELNNPFMIYNGETPLDDSGNPVCQSSGSIGANEKRQTGGSCVRPDSPDSEASSSRASASSASLASASSSSLSSVSSASLASLSSASLASISSVLTASKTTTSTLPVGKYFSHLASR